MIKQTVSRDTPSRHYHVKHLVGDKIEDSCTGKKLSECQLSICKGAQKSHKNIPELQKLDQALLAKTAKNRAAGVA